jgi:DNA invertase Pin-like site-specific DNA recombinase
LDRLVRPLKDLIDLVELLQAMRVGLLSLQEAISFLKPDQEERWSGRLLTGNEFLNRD